MIVESVIVTVAVMYALVAYGVGLRFYWGPLTSSGTFVQQMRNLILLVCSPLAVLLLLATIALRGPGAFRDPPRPQ